MDSCSIDKEFNPKTCRYVKECKPGQVRNEKFKCISSRLQKSRMQKSNIQKSNIQKSKVTFKNKTFKNSSLYNATVKVKSKIHKKKVSNAKVSNAKVSRVSKVEQTQHELRLLGTGKTKFVVGSEKPFVYKTSSRKKLENEQNLIILEEENRFTDYFAEKLPSIVLGHLEMTVNNNILLNQEINFHNGQGPRKIQNHIGKRIIPITKQLKGKVYNNKSSEKEITRLLEFVIKNAITKIGDDYFLYLDQKPDNYAIIKEEPKIIDISPEFFYRITEETLEHCRQIAIAIFIINAFLYNPKLNKKQIKILNDAGITKKSIVHHFNTPLTVKQIYDIRKKAGDWLNAHGFPINGKIMHDMTDAYTIKQHADDFFSPDEMLRYYGCVGGGPDVMQRKLINLTRTLDYIGLI